MARPPISAGMQLLIELIDTPHWDQLRSDATNYAQVLVNEALTSAKNPMDFYAKEGAARAARELIGFFDNIEYHVRNALSPQSDDNEEWGA